MYLAICLDCKPVLPQPFSERDERDEWSIIHKNSTGHCVEVRSDHDPATCRDGDHYGQCGGATPIGVIPLAPKTMKRFGR